MSTSTSNIFGHVKRRKPCRICWKPDWRSFYVKFHPLFLANLSSILTQLQNHCWKTSISIFLLPFHRRFSPHRQVSGRKQKKSGVQERGRGASTTQYDCTRRQRIPASNQEGEMIINRETIRPVSLTAPTDNFVCHCEGAGWILIEGKGVKECGCRIRAKTIRKLERIPPEYEHLRIESVAPDLKRHPRQSFVWQTVKKHPDLCYLLCGQPGAGKSAVLWALYARGRAEPPGSSDVAFRIDRGFQARRDRQLWG